MLFNKKAQGMSVNVIIIAALGLAVLIVMFAVFTGRISIFSSSLDSCTNLGGKCRATVECTTGDETERKAGGNARKFSDCIGTEICCIPIPGAKQQSVVQPPR